MNERTTSLTYDDLLAAAAGLAGDGQGGELGENPEYERGMAELIVRATNRPAYETQLVIEAIHARAQTVR